MAEVGVRRGHRAKWQLVLVLGVLSAFATPAVAVPAMCGNGIIDGPDVCDDGNTKGNDGCSADCSTIEPGFVCISPGSPCEATCGDGLVVGSESCDDGDTQSGDGCSASCTVEPGFVCPTPGEACTIGRPVPTLSYWNQAGIALLLLVATAWQLRRKIKSRRALPLA